jgi:hypothetical protein
MSARSRLVSVLLRVYPPEWRAEYGPELAGILERGPLGVGPVADLLWSGVRQRAKVAEPATLCGLVAMLIIGVGVGMNVAGIPAFGRLLPSSVQDSWKLFPTVVATPLESELFVLSLITCGCWTVLRQGEPSRPGVAAMKVTLLAGAPIMFGGLLMLLGLLDVTTGRPGDPLTNVQEHRFTYTYYTTLYSRPSPIAILIAPLMKLPESWLWGALGGRFGRSVVKSRADRTA